MKKINLLILFYSISIMCQGQQFNGFWEAKGYGFFAEIANDQFDLYSMNSTGLVPQLGFPLVEGSQLGFGNNYFGDLSIENDQLILTFGTTVDVGNIRFESVSSMPNVLNQSTDPVTNFEFFWTMIEEYCSLFPILDVNWQEQYDLYRPQIDENTSEEDLFEILSLMITELNDGHCFIFDQANSRGFSSGPQATGLWANFPSEMKDLIVNDYLDELSVNIRADNRVIFGTLNNGAIGYLNILQFEFDQSNLYNENLLFDEVLEEAFDYLKNTEKLIIDIRCNSNGNDSHVLQLANRLTKLTIPVCEKQVRYKEAYNEFSDLVSYEITPSNGTQYVDKPVVVLTSNVTASAADVFSMVAKEIDCVTTLGDTTYGIFSDVIIRRLPNQWVYSFSTERLFDNTGINHEQMGIVPDVLVEDNYDAFQNDEDNVLEYAIENIGSSCGTVSLQDLENESNIKIYPNPFTHSIFAKALSNLNESSTISIFNISGVKVFTQQFEKQNLEKEQILNLHDLPTGIYNLLIETETQRLNSKLVKTNF